MYRSEPLVSVLLPCFNARRWIGAATDSILQQTVSDFEVVLVDDGSERTSYEAVASIAASDRRIRLVRNERNEGIVAALNRAIAESRGDYIARMDADDIAVANRLERQLEFIGATGTDLCGSWFVEFGRGIARAVRWPHTEEAVRVALLFQNTMCHPTLMGRREVFESFKYRETYRLAEDYDFVVRAAGKYRVGNVPEILLHYRRHSQQATFSSRDAMERIACQVRRDALEYAGIVATAEEQRLHNLIRAPYSILNFDDLLGIERWLIKLVRLAPSRPVREVIGSQWVRACVRAAPLGRLMWHAFLRSPLREFLQNDTVVRWDLRALAFLKWDYRSRPFETFRRFGLSA